MTEPHGGIRSPKRGIERRCDRCMGRYCYGEIGFLGGDRGIMNVRKESGTIDVAILATIHIVKIIAKELKDTAYTSLMHNISFSCGCANTSSRILLAIINHGASGSFSMKQYFAR